MIHRRLILKVLRVLVVMLLWSAGGWAEEAAPELPTEPILRIEAGQHVAIINDTDAANRFAVTASDDKTARVWSLPDGHPLRVLRLPINPGNIGKAYAVAISPNGGTVAVGGWTGPEGHQNIFLFDRATGEFKQRLPDLPNVVTHLAYSPDGRLLAASLAGQNGIRVFNAGDGYRLLPSDTEYGDDSYSAAFDRSGRLVTTSLNGYVRLYAADHYGASIARVSLRGQQPMTAAFSPDGTRVAVGCFHNKVLVVSGKDLEKLFEADTTGIPDGNGLVAWSDDGRFLFADGGPSGNDVFKIRRWSESGHGTFVDIPVTKSDSIREILPLKDGRMLFAHATGFGLIGQNAEVVEIQGFGALDLDIRSSRPLLVSADGTAVQVDALAPPHTYRFALGRRQVDYDPRDDRSLVAPIIKTSKIAVTRWRASETPALNGKPLRLYPHEQARSLAIVPGGQHFVLGTSWALRLFDKSGHEVWPEAVGDQGYAFQVNVSSDGWLVIVAYSDGTIRWRRLSDGQEVLALFMHPDGQRWIAWTPQGYYDAALGADDLIGWHINHSYDRAPDFYPVSQFRDHFYRPDVIQRALKTPNFDAAEAVREADAAAQTAGRTMTKGAPVSSLLTPVVEIHGLKDPAPEDHTDIELTYSVRLPSADDTLRVEARIDGVEVPTNDDRLVDKGDSRAGSLHLVIPRRNSTVSVIAYNGKGASVPALVHVQWTGAGTEPKLTLYVLAIGISNYLAAEKDPKMRLHFAAKDAADFVAVAEAQAGGLYEKVIPYPKHASLMDGDATKDAILDGLDWIMRAVTNTNDVAMVYLSGHGITTPDQHYRFLPYDYDPERVERTTISDSELQDYLTKIGGKKIFFFDTCYSGNVLAGARSTDSQANVDQFANDLKAAPNGIVVFASSTGNQFSLERNEWNNGAFTKSLVEGMRGAAARQGMTVISISDLEGYVSWKVKELTNGNQRPVMAMPKTVDDYWIAQRLN
jgi:WD40 repeat protein